MPVDRIDQPLDCFLDQQLVDHIKRHTAGFWKQLRKLHPPRGGFNNGTDRRSVLGCCIPARLDFRMQRDRTGLQSVIDLGHGTEDHAFALFIVLLDRDIVEPQNNILRRNNNRLTIGR